MSKLIQKIILFLFCSLYSAGSAVATEFEWMQSTLTELATLFSTCIERPVSPGVAVNQTQVVLVPDVVPGGHSYLNDGWQPTGVSVEGEKMIEFEWNTQLIYKKAKVYKVLYRIDPRFEVPQIFIKEMNTISGSYTSDFHEYLGGQLVRYQEREEIDFANRTRDFVDYFNFVGRDEIMMERNDAVNIVMEDASEFFVPASLSNSYWWWWWGTSTNPDNEFSSEYALPSGDAISEFIYTNTGFSDNKILYMNANHFCTGVPSSNCLAGTPDLYENAANPRSVYVGGIKEPDLFNSVASSTSCGDSVVGRDHAFCYYDKGRGVRISQAGTTIKDTYEKFITSDINGKQFYYYVADADGPLRFSTDMEIAGMVTNYTQFMKDWNQASFADFRQYLTDLAIPQSQSPFIHTGRYAFTVEIGRSDGSLSAADIDSIDFRYYIQQDGDPEPDSSTPGTQIDQNHRENAVGSGYVWLKATTDNNTIIGHLIVNIKNYIGSQWFSETTYSVLVGPMRDKLNDVSSFIYAKLITDSTLQRIARTALILYIIIYGLMFLMGAAEITVTEIVTRVVKIALVLLMFSDDGWYFFNTYLFNLFVEGTDYLMSSVVGETSEVGNPFRFIDPVLDRYTNPTFWALLGIQLLQIHNGLCFFAILTIYSILIYYRAVIEVILSYVIAYIGMSVLISLAPFFIILLLFEKTKSMFDAWISSLFNLMIQPTILLIFFLLIDQMMAQQITNLVVRACWDILIPINIALDLNHLGIPISFSFPLPFLPGIPFFVSQVEGVDSTAMLFGQGGTFMMIATSSLLFFAYCKLASGLIDYVSLVVQMLTNVQPARQYGKLQGGSGIINDIKGDQDKFIDPFMGAAKGTAKKIGKFGKRKLIDQKYDEGISERDKKEEERSSNTSRKGVGGSSGRSGGGNSSGGGSAPPVGGSPFTPSGGSSSGGSGSGGSSGGGSSAGGASGASGADKPSNSGASSNSDASARADANRPTQAQGVQQAPSGQSAQSNTDSQSDANDRKFRMNPQNQGSAQQDSNSQSQMSQQTGQGSSNYESRGDLGGVQHNLNDIQNEFDSTINNMQLGNNPNSQDSDSYLDRISEAQEWQAIMKIEAQIETALKEKAEKYEALKQGAEGEAKKLIEEQERKTNMELEELKNRREKRLAEKRRARDKK